MERIKKTKLNNMKIVLDKYRTNLTFTIEENEVIGAAIESGAIFTDDILDDFKSWSGEQLAAWDDVDEEKVMDFDEHYSNGGTHFENFIKLIEFINN